VWRPGRGDGILAPWRWWVLAGMVLAGGAVEIVQSFVGREAELADWVAEIVAVVAAAGVVWVLRREAVGSPRGESSAD